jgi:C1A family cysteine protease
MVNVFAVVLVFLALLSCVSGYITEREYQREFTRFVKVYNKRYVTDEFFSRFEIFKANLDLIEAHNSRADATSTMGVNQFADWTSEEMARKLNGYRPINKVKNVVHLRAPRNAPASLDWSAKGAVTAVKDQGQCGSCWSFSATGSIEGAVYLKRGNLTSLSEQQLMDCSHPEGDDSCEGGLMDDAFQFVLDNKGICAEADYPYKAKDEKCVKTCKVVSTISSFVDVAFDSKHPTDESALMAAVNIGPVSIAIEADQPVFQLYTGGVITKGCGTSLDHGVLIVGYGTDSTTNVDYWLVKNSWGAKWGEKGYVRLARNANVCGLNMVASYPVA